jgi:hypothetical protein
VSYQDKVKGKRRAQRQVRGKGEMHREKERREKKKRKWKSSQKLLRKYLRAHQSHNSISMSWYTLTPVLSSDASTQRQAALIDGAFDHFDIEMEVCHDQDQHCSCSLIAAWLLCIVQVLQQMSMSPQFAKKTYQPTSKAILNKNRYTNVLPSIPYAITRFSWFMCMMCLYGNVKMRRRVSNC